MTHFSKYSETCIRVLQGQNIVGIVKGNSKKGYQLKAKTETLTPDFYIGHLISTHKTVLSVLKAAKVYFN